MGVAEPAQLTLEHLDAARARVPSGLWQTLSSLEQGFVAALLLDPKMELAEAARRAGYAARGARQRGFEASQRPRVKAALAALMAQREERTATDAVYVIKRLRENDEHAWEEKDLSASNAALGLLGKATGAFEKRVRISFDDPAVMLAQLKAMPKAERAKVIRTMLEEAAT